MMLHTDLDCGFEFGALVAGVPLAPSIMLKYILSFTPLLHIFFETHCFSDLLSGRRQFVLEDPDAHSQSRRREQPLCFIILQSYCH